MNAQQIQNEFGSLHYWDARVLRLDSSYFGDELTLVFEDSDCNKKIQFTGCSKILFSTSVNDRLNLDQEWLTLICNKC